MKFILKTIPGLFLLCAVSCKEDTFDKVRSYNITGQVINQCTGKGFANVTVSFVGSSSNISTISDSTGNFRFDNVSIHDNPKYNYSVGVETYYHGPYISLGGNGTSIDKNNPEKKLIVNVATYGFCLGFVLNPQTTITYPDTISVDITQNIFHQNNPGALINWKETFTTKQFPYSARLQPCLSGWWNITIYKSKNGITTITADSIYVAQDATITDTIPW